jgi:predicted signal transduction protein with EAL and GGDEF domain
VRRKLLDSFSHPVLTETGVEALFVVVHMGISVYPDDGRDADTLLKNADLARYEAKNTNEKIVFYTERLESHIAENTLFTNRLFKSLENEEFFWSFNLRLAVIRKKPPALKPCSDGRVTAAKGCRRIDSSPYWSKRD